MTYFSKWESRLFAIFTCYNCGKTHIRDVKEDPLVKACASHPPNSRRPLQYIPFLEQ